MEENTRGQRNSSRDQGLNSESDKNRKQNISNQDQQGKESRQGSGRSFNSPGINEEIDRSGLNQGRQNASATRGGTTDMDNDSSGGTRRTNPSEKSSATTTKRNVTGSDYDGQVSE